MKLSSYYICLIVLIGLLSCNDSEDDRQRKKFNTQIIPEPNKINKQHEFLLLNSNITIKTDNAFGDISNHTDMLQKFLNEQSGYGDKGEIITFSIINKPALGVESYELFIGDKNIQLHGEQGNGV